MKKFLFIILLTLALPQTLHAANWYLSQSVASSGDGKSWQSAWKNASNVVWTSLAPGDSLIIDGGSSGYTYNTFPTISANGISIVRSTEAGRNGTVTLGAGWKISGSNNIVDGGIWHGFTFNSNSTISISGNNNTLRNTFFNGNYGAGSGHSLSITASNGTTLIAYTDFYQSSFEDQWDLPNVSGGTFIFDHCVFRDNCSPNSYLGECGNPNDYCHRDVANPYTGSGGWNLTISNSIFYNTPGHASRQPQGDEILLQVGYGGGASPINNVTAYNNVVYNTARFIAFGSKNSGVTTFKVYNNTIHNAINGDNLGITATAPATGPTQANNIGNNSNPGFVDTSSPLGIDGKPFTADDGFNLTSGSSAINKGSALAEVTTDIRGNPRGASPDMGAYEYVATPTAKPLPPANLHIN